MIKVATIILNWNGLKITRECLKSVEKLDRTDIDLKTIVVDNASTDSSVSELSREFKEITFIKNPKNFGFAKGNNIGIKEALLEKCDYIMLLNNDTILDSQCLIELLQAQKKHPGYSIFAPKIYFEKNFEFHKDRYKENELGKVIWYAGGEIDWNNIYGHHRGVDLVENGQFDDQTDTDFATGAAMLVKRDVFEKVGFLDEDYFLYYEDTDFCVRAKISGFKILFVPQSFLWHKNAGSSSSGSTLQDYYITRNRLLFGFKYASIKAKFALLRQALKISFTKNADQKEGVLDFLKGKKGER